MSIERIPSYSTPTSSHWKHDVFLSFRGEDTRKKFTSHLYKALNERGIDVFWDDKELERGKSISPELLQAIEDSRFLIVVISRNYASSTWCLDELVKIVECKKYRRGQNVIPIFYDVDPSTVRKQTGSFHQAFTKHEEVRENIEKLQKWKSALIEVANLSGWDAKDRDEPKLIEEIVKEISSKLRVSTYICHNDLVGIDTRLEKLKKLIDIRSDNVRMIGIHGMGGIGKTTIARVVYDLISHEFDDSSFLANVREISKKCNGLVSLQKQLLSQIHRNKEFHIWDTYEGIIKIEKSLRHKKVLVVIDDVTDVNQLEKLAGNRNWFGLGSRILITTRNVRVLKVHQVDEMYKAQPLNDVDAHKLFNLKAFGHGPPLNEYEKLSKHFVKYADGLPLALKVLGSLLFRRNMKEWESTQQRLKSDSAKEILDILRISYDALEDEKEKTIFLDMACFFNGCNQDYVKRILDGCGFNLDIGIPRLIERSLLTITENNQLQMHDLLQKMGRQIVRRECPKEPGKRTRVWEKADVRHLLVNNTGTDQVEGIVLEEKLHLGVSAAVFSKMNNLRLLKIHNVQLPKGLSYLPNELRLLEWHGYPLKSLPSNFQLNEIVEIDLSYSCIQQLWKGNPVLNGLKSITLIDCKNLKETPDFTRVPNLEKLILEGCTMLREIHPSVLVHKNITLLNLRNCTNLTTLPREIYMESCQTLDLSGCFKLRSENDDNLETLDIRGTATRQPVQSVLSMENLKKYYQWYWQLLPSWMQRRSNSMAFRLSSLLGCPSLTNLILRDCNIGEGAIPSEIGNLYSLRRLDLSENNFVSLPASISRLSHIIDLFLEGCSSLQFLPEIPVNTELLIVNGCVSLETSSTRFRLCHLNSPLVCVFGVNCPKLIGSNNTGFSSLKDYLTSALSLARSRSIPLSLVRFSRKVFHIVIPGNEIPEWCHQSEGSSIKIKRHPHFYHNSKLIGYVVCCVFFVHEHAPVPTDERGLTHGLEFHLFSVDQEVHSNNIPGHNFVNRSGHAISDHIWLIFLSRHEYISRKVKDIYNPIRFKIYGWGQGLEVRRCGARPIYEQDVEDQFNQSSSSTVWNLNNFPQDFGDATSDSSVDDYDDLMVLISSLHQWSTGCSGDESCDNGAESSGDESWALVDMDAL